MQTALLGELKDELDARFLAIDKAVLNLAGEQLLLLLEYLPAKQDLYEKYKQFIQEYKVLCRYQKLPTNF